VFCLDAFDEYEKGSVNTASDRSFKGFQHLDSAKSKIVLTCRSNFFRRLEDIFLYQLKTHEFELCPSSARVVELLPLKPTVVKDIIKEFFVQEVPDWLCRLADRPLYLRMLVPLLKSNSIDFSYHLKKHELYEKFINYVLDWDLIKHGANKITSTQSRALHISLSERFLEKGESSLTDVELFNQIEKVFTLKPTEDKFAVMLFFFRQSGLLRFEGGRIVFSHKSFREYLVAKKIFDLIVLEDDSFDFIWFTRNERDFIVEMLSSSEKHTICSWLENETRYPACNYASFILGGTSDKQMIPFLKNRLENTLDPLIKINCSNSLAALGDDSGKFILMGFINGYLIDKKLSTIPIAGADSVALLWASELKKKYGKNVMLIHLCESVDAISKVGDANSVDILKQLYSAPDQSVIDEASGAIRRLVNRLGSIVKPIEPKSSKRKR
jgi:hypothetical protein